MQISIGTNMLECGPDWRLARHDLSLLAEAGARYFELHMGVRYEPSDGPFPLRTSRRVVDWEDDNHFREIAGWADELGLKPVCLHSSIMGAVALASAQESIRRYAVHVLRGQVRLACALKIPTVVVHAAREEATNAIEQLKCSLDEVSDDLERSDVSIAIENLPPGDMFASVERLSGFLERYVSARVGACLDTGHAHLNGVPPASGVEILGRKLIALHVHDNHGRGDDHLPPFAGSIDWTGFVDALQAAGYPGTLNLEICDTTDVQCTSALELVRLSLARAQRLQRGDLP